MKLATLGSAREKVGRDRWARRQDVRGASDARAATNSRRAQRSRPTGASAPAVASWLGLMMLVVGFFVAGCATTTEHAEAQIRERIFSIRDAIRAKEPEGIVRWGTPDWSFTGPDGKTFDREKYLVRARGLFAGLVSLDSLETTVDRVEVDEKRGAAEVEITQVMERHERNATTGQVEHVRLRYRERHMWVRASDGWRVRRVAFLGAPERTVVSGR